MWCILAVSTVSSELASFDGMAMWACGELERDQCFRRWRSFVGVASLSGPFDEVEPSARQRASRKGDQELKTPVL